MFIIWFIKKEKNKNKPVLSGHEHDGGNPYHGSTE